VSIVRRSLLLLALLCCFAPKAPAARVCIAGGECRERECALGVLDPGTTAIRCDGDAAVHLRVTNFPRRGNVRVRLTDEAQRTWELQLRQNVTLRVARGTYDVLIETPHFRTVRKSLRVAEKPETVVVTLEPLPVLSGRVFERGTADGVGGAVIATNVDTMAIADASGFFSIEAEPDRWPSKLVVSAAGFAESALAVPKARRSATLDDVLLSRGGTIDVEVLHPDPEAVTEIELQRLASGAMTGAPLKSVAGPARARFENVAPGRYLMLAKGAGPCERHGQVIELAQAEQKSVQLRIAPIQLTLHAAMAGEPLAGAEVRFRSREGFWSGRLSSDAAGEVATALWQSGDATASVFVDGLMNVPHLESRTVPDDEEEFEWSLEVSPRRISGIVVDSRSGEPVPNAAISLKVRGAISFGVRTRGDAQGRFHFMPVPYGRHTITAAAPTHLQREMSYTFAAPEENRELTVPLDGGTFVRLHVIDAAGAPVAGAVAMQYQGLVQTRLSATDASGVAEILVPDGETRDVYVVPRDGSFGIIRVTAKSAEPSLRLPRATSRIEIRAESESRQPIANVSVAMRYNRQVLPREVVHELGRTQGARTTSRADGRIVFDPMPAGLYDFWPAGSPAEMRLLVAGIGGQAPVTMNVVPGDNVAVLTFAPVRP
jgi:hypothetical protein